ncbi:VOC family protein [Planktotalea sp.]|uniref:VOC family protein n=1 Tax=Planktotalea sp. TaxID=2029877 RepID=UPI003298663D
MAQHISAFAIVVPDYDEGIDFYVNTLGFELIEDTRQSDTKRWVLVAPKGADTRILLAKAVGAEQSAAIGNQTGGRVGFFLNTDDFETDYKNMKNAGVYFEEDPRYEPYGSVAVFQDPFGNRWDLLQLNA